MKTWDSYTMLSGRRKKWEKKKTSLLLRSNVNPDIIGISSCNCFGVILISSFLKTNCRRLLVFLGTGAFSVSSPNVTLATRFNSIRTEKDNHQLNLKENMHRRYENTL